MRRRALLAVPFVLMAVIATTESADAGLPSSATHVAVSLGSQHSGIDGHLVAAASIAGTLKSSTGARLSGTVTAYRSGRPVAFGSVNNGDYVINGLAAGSYAVCMNGANVFTPNTSTGFLGRCYKSAAFNGVTVPSTAALITVHTNPATHRTGVNFVLPAAAAIAGKITSPTGAGLSSAFVIAYNRSTRAVFFGFSGTNGSYSVKNLTPAAKGYTACVRSFATTGTGYLPRCYKNKPWNGNGSTTSTANAVSVALGHVHTGINQALPRAGAISGKVVDASTGKPVKGDTIAVYLAGRVVNGASTSSTGTYVVRGLAASTGYRVCASPTNVTAAIKYKGQCWKNRAWSGGRLPSGTTAVAVKLARTHTGINFRVGKTVTRFGSIAGTVTEKAAKQPVQFATVTAYTSGGSFAGSATTDTSGRYKVGLLRASSTGYVVCVKAEFAFSTTPTPATGWAPRCYVDAAWNGVNLPSAAKRIPLSTGQNKTGVNVSLPVGGAIAGTTYSGPGTTTKAVGVAVKVFTTGGRLVTTAFSNFADGTYTVAGLGAGSYVVCFDGRQSFGGAGYLPQCYNGVAWSG